jgi:hypothetical protein
MSINLHVHETLSCMFASQSQMLFDKLGWKNVVLGQNLIGQKVAGNAIHVVFNDLLRVLSKTSQVGMELFGVRCQESIHAYFAQAVRTCSAKQYHPHYTVSLLLNWHFGTINNQGE